MAVAVLDGVDGWLARAIALASDFGARFDMETDALFILVLAVLAWQFGKAGPGCCCSGCCATPSSVRAWSCFGCAVRCRHSPRRKIIAVVQVVALIVTIAPFVPAAVAAPAGRRGAVRADRILCGGCPVALPNAARSRSTVSQP